MTVWRSFWTYPPSATLVPPQPGTGNGNIDTLITRAAILLHEVCDRSAKRVACWLTRCQAFPLQVHHSLLDGPVE